MLVLDVFDNSFSTLYFYFQENLCTSMLYMHMNRLFGLTICESFIFYLFLMRATGSRVDGSGHKSKQCNNNKCVTPACHFTLAVVKDIKSTVLLTSCKKEELLV